MVDQRSADLPRAAFQLAMRGIPVFPLKPRTKEPAVSGGLVTGVTGRDSHVTSRAGIVTPHRDVEGVSPFRGSPRCHGCHDRDIWH